MMLQISFLIEDWQKSISNIYRFKSPWIWQFVEVHCFKLLNNYLVPKSNK